MESIVNPWFIYLLELAGNLPALFCLFSILTPFFAWVIMGAKDNFNITPWEAYNKLNHKLWGTLIILSITIATLIPSKKTIIAMYVANEVTYERAEKAVDITKDLKNTLKKDIIDIIQEVTKEDAKQ